MSEFEKGDKVSWNTPQGETHGEVVEKLTKPKRVKGEPGQKGTEIKASKDDPRYLVKSDKSGKTAAHKPESLKKR